MPVPRDLDPDDASRPSAGPGRMLGRGLRRRCPRCGSGGLFRTYWSIHDRCPRCGLLFAREPGYFTGVYLLNLSAILAVLFVLVMAYAVWRANGGDGGLALPLAAGVAVSIALPIALYPVARTLWSALDLLMAPMELDEILDAAEASDPGGEDDPDGDGPDGEGGGGGGPALPGRWPDP